MVSVYILLLAVVGIADGDFWSRISLSREHKFFLKTSSSSITQCSFTCQQFHLCFWFGFKDYFCYCLDQSTHYNNQVYLDYYYERDMPITTVLTTSGPVSVFENNGYFIYNGTIGLKLSTETRPWEDASNNCLADGAKLFELNSLFKRDLLFQFLSDITFTTGGTFHVGLKYVPNTWRWSDGGTDIFYLENNIQPGELCSKFDNSIQNISSTNCNNSDKYLCEFSIPDGSL